MASYNYNWPAVSISSGPIQFNYNAAATTVSEDTVTPGNSKPLPVITLSSTGNVTDTNFGTVGANTPRTAAEIGNATGAADFGFGTVGAQTLRTAAEVGNAAGAADFNFGAASAQTLRSAAVVGNATGAADFNYGTVGAQTLRSAAQVGNATGAADFNFGTVGAQTLRSAAQIGNVSGAADFNAGATGAQTLRAVANQGAPNTIANAWKVAGTDGTNSQAYLATGEAKVSVSQPLPAGTNAIGTVKAQLQDNAGTAIVLGQTTKSASLPVSLASDQGAVSIGNSTLALTTVGISAVNGDVVASVDVSAYPYALFQLTGTWVGTVSFQGSNDNTNFISISAQSVSAATASAVQTATAVGAFVIPLQAKYLRIRVTAYTSGTVTGAGVLTSNAAPTLGQVSSNVANASIAVTQSGVWTVQPGNTANTTAWLVSSRAATPTAGTVTSAAKTVGTTAARLTVAGTAPSATRSVLVATMDSLNTGKCYIGPSTVTSSGTTRGIQLLAGEKFIANNDAGDYYIIADAASQTVEVMEQV